MRAIFESLFDVAYLITVITMGTLILRRARSRADTLAGSMALILGFGDAFHLVPRIVALNTVGVEAAHVALGYGKLVTAITMTVFYRLLYLLIQERWPRRRSLGLDALVYGAAVVHILMVLLPQNETFSANPPLEWGIARNIPFAVLGVAIIGLLARRAGRDRFYRWGWLAVTLSFAFYAPVVLFGHVNEAVGLLMIPKTLAYVWLVWMGFRAAGQGDADGSALPADAADMPVEVPAEASAR